jgi:hypothetical protein
MAGELTFFEIGEVDETGTGGGDYADARFARFRFCRDDQGSAFGLHRPPEGS